MKINWLKNHIGSLAVLLVTVAVSIYLAIAVNQHGPFYFHDSGEDLNSTLMAFRQKNKPTTEINFSTLYSGNNQFQVLHPLLEMSNLKYREENPTCSDDEVSIEGSAARSRRVIETMRMSLNNEFSQKKQLSPKSEVFEQFLNGREKLPDDFVLNPPFIDEWGNSFVYRLVQQGSSPYSQKGWVERHLSFLKISELEKVLTKYQIDDSKYWTLSRLTEAEVEDLVKANPLVITKDYLFLKNQSRFGFSPLSYWVYDIKDFRADLKNSKYELSIFTPGAVCLQKIGNGCWTYSSKHTMTYLNKYSTAIVLLIGLVLLICLVFYFRHLYEKGREQCKNRLALQVLSHEFRTPVSAMILMIEQLSKKQSKLEIEDQDLMTRISTEVFRLQRIIEICKTYLQAESHRVHFKTVKINSINNWISDFIAETSSEIRSELLQRDQDLEADPFWLKFILSSLVQNAFLHGKPPVFIRLSNDGGKIRITVEDQGNCEFTNLNQMTDAFVKSKRSQGMGLGLNIAKFILDEWRVEIEFSKLPTSFSLLFKLPKQVN